ncbi:MAG: Gfo/Idh/MocA family oxidoreductase [Clostridia bacterium]|nr:Gfo/Idh/MocA family oxidoreductase [Clostridia bacterium]
MEKLRLGLIGCGGMMELHAQSVHECTKELEITAVCDIIRERAEKVAAVLNNPYITTDYTDMLDYVDAVLVALPHDLHYECGVFFAHNKKHVLMEKPLANSEEECLRLIQVCEEEGVTLMCAYPVRYWPGVVKLKELVDSGEYGKVMQMSIWTEQLTNLGELHWSNTARIGGGQLFSHGCHYIDVMMWFLGEPVTGAHVGSRVGTPWLMREGSSMVTLKFASGVIGYHGATWGARGSKQKYSFQVHTEKGLLEYDHFSGVINLYQNFTEHRPDDSDSVQEKRELWRLGGQVTKATEFEISHFVDCVRNNKTPLTNGPSALQGLRVIWALYDAEKQGKMADLRGLGLKDELYEEERLIIE